MWTKFITLPFLAPTAAVFISELRSQFPTAARFLGPVITAWDDELRSIGDTSPIQSHLLDRVRDRIQETDPLPVPSLSSLLTISEVDLLASHRFNSADVAARLSSAPMNILSSGGISAQQSESDKGISNKNLDTEPAVVTEPNLPGQPIDVEMKSPTFKLPPLVLKRQVKSDLVKKSTTANNQSQLQQRSNSDDGSTSNKVITNASVSAAAAALSPSNLTSYTGTSISNEVRSKLVI